MPATLHDITGALRRKAAKLFHASGFLLAKGQNEEATLDKQEAEDSSNRADALEAGDAFKNFPSDAVLAQLAAGCDALQTAMDTSAGVAAVVAAAANVRDTMPGNTV